MSSQHDFVRIRDLYGHWLGTGCPGLKAYPLNRLCNLYLWWIGLRGAHLWYYGIVCLRSLKTQPLLTTSQSRRHLQHLCLSGDDIKRLHQLTKRSWWWCGCSRVCLGPPNSWNLEFSRPVLHISLTGVVNHVAPSRLHHLVKPHRLLPKALHAVLYRFGDCAHHAAWFVIFAQLAMPSIIFVLILIFPILLIFGTCKITQTVSHSIQHFLEFFFRLCGCRASLFNISHIFLLLIHCRLCVMKWLCCHCGL